jgi:hypothetical protein
MAGGAGDWGPGALPEKIRSFVFRLDTDLRKDWGYPPANASHEVLHERQGTLFRFVQSMVRDIIGGLGDPTQHFGGEGGIYGPALER